LHWNELLKFSRRTEESINRWASRYGIADNTEETYKKAKSKGLGRYVAVNITNCNTIEFRMFRGTLRYKTFIATLQLVSDDDAGTIHPRWDTGSHLGLVYGEDSFRKLTPEELEQEKV
jgi:hypothetical protein